MINIHEKDVEKAKVYLMNELPKLNKAVEAKILTDYVLNMLKRSMTMKEHYQNMMKNLQMFIKSPEPLVIYLLNTFLEEPGALFQNNNVHFTRRNNNGQGYIFRLYLKDSKIEKVRVVRILENADFLDLKVKIAECFEDTFYINIQKKNGIEIYFLFDDDWVFMNCDHDWDVCKFFYKDKNEGSMKIKIEFTKNLIKGKKVPFVDEKSLELKKIQHVTVPTFNFSEEQFYLNVNVDSVDSFDRNDPTVKDFTEKMRIIEEMGFNDKSKNILLMKKHQGNIERVLSEFLKK